MEFNRVIDLDVDGSKFWDVEVPINRRILSEILQTDLPGDNLGDPLEVTYLEQDGDKILIHLSYFVNLAVGKDEMRVCRVDATDEVEKIVELLVTSVAEATEKKTRKAIGKSLARLAE